MRHRRGLWLHNERLNGRSAKCRLGSEVSDDGQRIANFILQWFLLDSPGEGFSSPGMLGIDLCQRQEATSGTRIPLIINFYLASWKQVGLWHVCVIFGKNEKKNLKVSQRTPNFFRTSGFLSGNCLISYQHRTFYRGTFCYLSSCDIFRRCGRRRPEKFSILPAFFFFCMAAVTCAATRLN